MWTVLEDVLWPEWLTEEGNWTIDYTSVSDLKGLADAIKQRQLHRPRKTQRDSLFLKWTL